MKHCVLYTLSAKLYLQKWFSISELCQNPLFNIPPALLLGENKGLPEIHFFSSWNVKSFRSLCLD